MANYKPLVQTIPSASAVSGTVVSADISTTSWGIFLLRGTAVFSNTVLGSAAVAVWESTNPTTAAPDRLTFTDVRGIYGITCRAGVALRLKVYDN